MSKQNETIIPNETQNKKISKKTIFVLIVILIICAIIGLQRIFTLLSLISIGIFIYRAIKKKTLKITAIICVVILLITGILNQFSSSDDYMEILSMTKEEVDRQYGEPQLSENGVGYIYPDGFMVSYDDNGKCWVFNLHSSTKEILDLQIGDKSSEIKDILKSNGYEFLEKRYYNNKTIFDFQNTKYLIQIYIENNYITEIQILNL